MQIQIFKSDEQQQHLDFPAKTHITNRTARSKMGESMFTSDDPEFWMKRLQRYDSVIRNKSDDKKKRELRLLDSW